MELKQRTSDARQSVMTTTGSMIVSGERFASQYAASRVGTTLKQRYFIERLIATGASCFVYSAVHKYGHRLAVKVLRPELAGNPVARERFLRGAYLANRIDHPSVVHVMDDDVTDDGAPFIATELVEGESLEARATRQGGALSPRLVVDVAIRLLDVLSAAHSRGIVHRDIKPENVFLTRHGSVKVTDFGAARQSQASGGGLSTTGVTSRMTAFISPEQATGHGNEKDARTDVWGVGATLFRLLSGHDVHDAESPDEQLAHARSREARSLATVAPHLDPRLVRIVDRALAFKPTDRWDSASAMAAALYNEFGTTGRRRDSDPGIPPSSHLQSRPPAPIMTRVGEEFAILLDQDDESGFEWVFDGATPRESVMFVASDTIKVPAHGAVRKKIVFTFRASRSGHVELAFRHLHPLDPANASVKVYRAQVTA